MATLREAKGLLPVLSSDVEDLYSPQNLAANQAAQIAGASQIGRGWESAGLAGRAGELWTDSVNAQIDGDQQNAAVLASQARDLQQQASAWAPTVQNFSDITGLRSGLDWAGGALGNLRTSVAPALGGLAGAAVGTVLGGPAGAAAGGFTGASLAGYDAGANEAIAQAMNDPDIRAARTPQEILNVGRMKGLGESVLEAIVPTILGGKLVGQGVKKAVGAGFGGAAARIGKEAAVGGATEFATEGAQSLGGQTAQNYLAGRNLTDYDYTQAANEGMAGLVGGGVMGSVGGAADVAYDRLGKGVARAQEIKADPAQFIADKAIDLSRMAGTGIGKAEPVVKNVFDWMTDSKRRTYDDLTNPNVPDANVDAYAHEWATHVLATQKEHPQADVQAAAEYLRDIAKPGALSTYRLKIEANRNENLQTNDYSNIADEISKRTGKQTGKTKSSKMRGTLTDNFGEQEGRDPLDDVLMDDFGNQVSGAMVKHGYENRKFGDIDFQVPATAPTGPEVSYGQGDVSGAPQNTYPRPARPSAWDGLGSDADRLGKNAGTWATFDADRPESALSVSVGAPSPAQVRFPGDPGVEQRGLGQMGREAAALGRKADAARRASVSSETTADIWRKQGVSEKLLAATTEATDPAQRQMAIAVMGWVERGFKDVDGNVFVPESLVKKHGKNTGAVIKSAVETAFNNGLVGHDVAKQIPDVVELAQKQYLDSKSVLDAVAGAIPEYARKKYTASDIDTYIIPMLQHVAKYGLSSDKTEAGRQEAALLDIFGSKEALGQAMSKFPTPTGRNMLAQANAEEDVFDANERGVRRTSQTSDDEADAKYESELTTGGAETRYVGKDKDNSPFDRQNEKDADKLAALEGDRSSGRVSRVVGLWERIRDSEQTPADREAAETDLLLQHAADFLPASRLADMERYGVSIEDAVNEMPPLQRRAILRKIDNRFKMIRLDSMGDAAAPDAIPKGGTTGLREGTSKDPDKDGLTADKGGIFLERESNGRPNARPFPTSAMRLIKHFQKSNEYAEISGEGVQGSYQMVLKSLGALMETEVSHAEAVQAWYDEVSGPNSDASPEVVEKAKAAVEKAKKDGRFTGRIGYKTDLTKPVIWLDRGLGVNKATKTRASHDAIGAQLPEALQIGLRGTIKEVKEVRSAAVASGERKGELVPFETSFMGQKRALTELAARPETSDGFRWVIENTLTRTDDEGNQKPLGPWKRDIAEFYQKLRSWDGTGEEYFSSVSDKTAPKRGSRVDSEGAAGLLDWLLRTVPEGNKLYAKRAAADQTKVSTEGGPGKEGLTPAARKRTIPLAIQEKIAKHRKAGRLEQADKLYDDWTKTFRDVAAWQVANSKDRGSDDNAISVGDLTSDESAMSMSRAEDPSMEGKQRSTTPFIPTYPLAYRKLLELKDSVGDLSEDETTVLAELRKGAPAWNAKYGTDTRLPGAIERNDEGMATGLGDDAVGAGFGGGSSTSKGTKPVAWRAKGGKLVDQRTGTATAHPSVPLDLRAAKRTERGVVIDKDTPKMVNVAARSANEPVGAPLATAETPNRFTTKIDPVLEARDWAFTKLRKGVPAFVDALKTIGVDKRTGKVNKRVRLEKLQILSRAISGPNAEELKNSYRFTGLSQMTAEAIMSDLDRSLTGQQSATILTRSAKAGLILEDLISTEQSNGQEGKLVGYKGRAAGVGESPSAAANSGTTGGRTPTGQGATVLKGPERGTKSEDRSPGGSVPTGNGVAGAQGKGVTPKAPEVVPMNFYDGITFGGVLHRMRPEFKGRNTLDLIKSGDRTATSRRMRPTVAVGDVLAMTNKSGERALVRVTKAPYKVSDVTPEQWSKLEGWDTSVYGPYKDAWQYQYELVEQAGAQGKGVTVSEHPSSGYRARTKYNADSADVTIAFAADYRTAGEQLTASVAGNKYVRFEGSMSDFIEAIVKKLRSVNGTSLNVAGNGIYTWTKHGKTQEQINKAMYDVLKLVNKYVPLSKIVTGGQTGSDIAGAIAARALGIPVEVTMPQGFLQRDAASKDSRHTREDILKQIEDGAAQLKDVAETKPETKPAVQTNQRTVERRAQITRAMLKAEPDTLFLFGDNDDRRGLGGQAASMRGESNAVGVRTKAHPTTASNAFWSDSQLVENKRKIDEDLKRAFEHKGKVVIPSAGLGSGLARLDANAPQTFAYLESRLKALEGEGEPASPTTLTAKLTKQLADAKTTVDKKNVLFDELKTLLDNHTERGAFGVRLTNLKDDVKDVASYLETMSTAAMSMREKLTPAQDKALTEMITKAYRAFQMTHGKSVVDVLEGTKQSKQAASSQTADDGTGRQLYTEAQIAAAEKLITDRLGDSVKVEFKPHFGDNSSGSWTPTDTKSIIRLALNGDIFGAAAHESMHEFFNILGKAGSKQTQDILLRTAKNPILLRQVERLLDGHPKAVEQIMTDPEEALAFMYQFWNAGLLKLGPQTKTLFQKIKDYIAKVLGKLSAEELDQIFVDKVFRAFDAGVVSKGSPYAKPALTDGKPRTGPEVMDGSVRDAMLRAFEQNAEAHNKALDASDKYGRNLVKNLGKLGFSAEAMMLATKNKQIEKIMRKFNQEAGTAMQTAGGTSNQAFFPGVHQHMGIYMNRLSNILTAYKPEDLELARKAMASDKVPTDRIAKEIAQKLYALNEDVFKYITSRKVMRRDDDLHTWVPVEHRARYFPQVWNTEEIAKDPNKVAQLLLQHHMKELSAIAAEANKEVKNRKKMTKGTASYDKLYAGYTTGTITEAMIADAIVARMMQSGGHVDLDETTSDLGISPAATSVNRRSLSWIDPEVFDEFKSKDMTSIMTSYISSMVKRAEYTKHFGPGGETLRDDFDRALLEEMGGEALIKRADAMYKEELERWHVMRVSAIKLGELPPRRPTLRDIGMMVHGDMLLEKAGKQLRSSDESKALAEPGMVAALKSLEQAAKAIMAMEGTLGSDISPATRKVVSAITAYQTVRLLPTVLFSSVNDVMGIVAQGGDLKDAWKSLVRGLREVRLRWKDEKSTDTAALRAEEWGTVEAGSHMEVLGQIYGSMYMTGMARKMSNSFFKWNGMEGWNRAMRIEATVVAERALTGLAKHGYDKTDKAAAARVAGLYGENFDTSKIALTPEGRLDTTDAANQAAMMRWVSNAIMTPNAAHRTIWGSDPRMAPFWHLKQFAYTFHRVMLKGAYEQAKLGNFRPAAVLALGYAPVTIAAGAVKEMMIPGEEPPWMQGGLDDYLAYGVSRAGIFGIPGMTYSSVSDDYGVNMLGPTVSQVASVPFDEPVKTGLRAMPLGTLLGRMAPSTP